MERHNTHILSCSSSLENNSYKFDKNGNIILDSISTISFINYKRGNKITTSELFKGIQNINENSITEEEHLLDKDNNISFSKNQLTKGNTDKYQIISQTGNFKYIPPGIENKVENINKTNQTKVNQNKDKKIISNQIKKETNLNLMTEKYEDKYLKEIKIEQIFIKSMKKSKNNQMSNRNKKKSNKENIKKKKGTYEYKATFSERMKFSSRTNSFLSPIKDKMKEKDNYDKNNDFIINLPINNLCYITKLSQFNISDENIKIQCVQDKNNKIKESIMLDEFVNKDSYEKIIKNKYKISDIIDKKSILNKTNENEYNKDYFNIPNDFEDNDFINNDDISNNQQQYNINNDKKYTNLFDIKNKDIEKHMNSNRNNFNNNYFKKENFTQRNYLLKNKYDEISNNPLLNPKINKLYENSNLHRHLKAYSSKKKKVPNSAFYSPYKANENTANDKTKTFYKIKQIKSPFSLKQKNIQKNRLFNNESTISKINSKKNIKYEKQNRNKSLVNIINHNHHHNIDLSKQENNHLYEQLIINEGKKYERHFGKEENCPICVALQMKIKLLEEEKLLPILKPSYLYKGEQHILTQSPNKFKENKERIMSCKIGKIRKLNIRRNESAKQIMNIKNRKTLENEKNEFIDNINAKKIFPCLNEYFNGKN